MGYGDRGAGPLTDNAHVRCVKDLPSGGKKYPYVTTNNAGQRNVIVLREGNNGLKTSALRANIDETPWADSYTDNCFLPYKLQVSKESLGYDFVKHATLKSKCKEYREGGYSNWRVPTVRELYLIYNLKAELDHKIGTRNFSNVRSAHSNGFGYHWNGLWVCLLNDLGEIDWDEEDCYPSHLDYWTDGFCNKAKAYIVCVRDA